jgi:hypothetical protein
MSGGSYDYVSFKIEEAASRLRSGHATEPHLLALAKHLDDIAKVMHDIEWAESGDTSWTEELDEQIRALLKPNAELWEAGQIAERIYAKLGRILDKRS